MTVTVVIMDLKMTMIFWIDFKIILITQGGNKEPDICLEQT